MEITAKFLEEQMKEFVGLDNTPAVRARILEKLSKPENQLVGMCLKEGTVVHVEGFPVELQSNVWVSVTQANKSEILRIMNQ